MIEDLKRITANMGRSLAVPISMIHDEVSVSFVPAFEAMKQSDREMRRVQRQIAVFIDDLMRAEVGLSPVSAVDRLADLLREDDDAP